MTGGGRGIGAATALRLGALGYAVAVNYAARPDTAEQVVATIRAAGGTAMAVQADVGEERDAERLFRTVDEAFGTVTALVNNAAILKAQTRLDAMAASRVTEILRVNVTGTLLCCREAVRRMSTAHGGAGGAIVNVSSASARLGSAGEYIDYAASKGAVDTITRGLSLEVAQEGIRVNGVRPGFIYTEMHADGGEPGRVERVAPTIPMRRGGTSEEVANAIVWLLSPEASYATGTFIDLAGGR